MAVSFDGTRIDAGDALTNWTNWGATATVETDYGYQNNICISCQVKTAEVGEYLTDPSTVNYDTTRRTVLFKVIQTNYVAIDGNGLQLYVGNDASNHYRYEIFSATTYPSLGGFQVVPIDPTISGFRTQTVGTMSDNTTIDFYGIKSDASATAKAPNLGMDAVDYITNGTGLTWTSTGGDFADFVSFDVGTSTNRYGIVTTKDDILYIAGVLTIGSSTATTFTDSNQELVFPDGRFYDGFCGITLDLQNASTAVTLDNCVFRGIGSYGADGGTVDTRPILDISGTSGSASFDGCSFLNHNQVNFTSVCSMDVGNIEAKLITQSGAHLSNLTITTDSLTSVATIQDPTFGTTSGLHDISFVQGGAGHAIELDTATSYTLTNIDFSGYGADTTDSAALDVTASSGTVTVNVIGGTSPTYKSAGATVDIVLNPVTFGVTVKDIDTQALISGARVLVEVANGTNYPYQASVTITGSGTTATVAHTGHGLSTNDNVVIRGANEDYYNGAYSITVTGVDAYTYTANETLSVSPATGTITSTFAVINASTTGTGYVSDSRTYGSGDQLITGWARKASSSPYYRQQPINETIDSSDGLSITVQLISDE